MQIMTYLSDAKPSEYAERECSAPEREWRACPVRVRRARPDVRFCCSTRT